MRRRMQYSTRFLLFVTILTASGFGYVSIERSRQIEKFRELQDHGILVHTEFRPPYWLPNSLASVFREAFLTPETASIHYEIDATNRICINGDKLYASDAKIRLRQLKDLASSKGFKTVTFSEIVDIDAGILGHSVNIAEILPPTDGEPYWIIQKNDYQKLLAKNGKTFSTH